MEQQFERHMNGHESETTVPPTNTVAALVKAVALIVGIITLAGALYLMATLTEEVDREIGLKTFVLLSVAGLLISLFTYAIGEALQLLQNIDFNTSRRRR